VHSAGVQHAVGRAIDEAAEPCCREQLVIEAGDRRDHLGFDRYEPARVVTAVEPFSKGVTEAAKRGWDVEPHTGAELEALAKEVINQPKEVIERAKWVLGN